MVVRLPQPSGPGRFGSYIPAMQALTHFLNGGIFLRMNLAMHFILPECEKALVFASEIFSKEILK
nr:hypothetical protein [uncultured Oscillibacter sp.]